MTRTVTRTMTRIMARTVTRTAAHPQGYGNLRWLVEVTWVLYPLVWLIGGRGDPRLGQGLGGRAGRKNACGGRGGRRRRRGE